jgi:hypothetical protein
MELTIDQRTELESVLLIGYDGSVSAWAQMVLWRADGHSVAGVAADGWHDEADCLQVDRPI